MAIDIRGIEENLELLRENADRLHCLAEEQYDRLRQCEGVVRMCNDELSHFYLSHLSSKFGYEFEAEFVELMAAFEKLMDTRYEFHNLAEGICQYANALQNYNDYIRREWKWVDPIM